MQARTFNGRYRLDDLIGEGGMAVVYRGYDLILNRVVAIKVLRDQYGSDINFLRRFEREAQSAARLSHPHIANVYDVGQDGDARYIVMEYVHGPNLKELIRRQGPFSVDGAAFIVRQVADALDYAHDHGLVHRDIKPQNILVDQNGTVKVVDFGIAKGLSDANLTEAGTGMGTVHYVSPEQARGESATPTSDVYATGVVLYEMLTKHLPFDADTPIGVAMQHVSVPPPLPRHFNPSIPPGVEDIVLRALAKEPEDRYASAGALAYALDRWNEVPAASQVTRAVNGRGAAPSAAGPRRPANRQRPAGARGGPPPSGRDQSFRDDLGCATWLIGIAILIGLVGLVIVGFKLGDFSFFEPTAGDSPTVTVTATTAASPTSAPSPTATPAASPTAGASPSPSPSATPGTPIPSPTATPTLAFVPELIGATIDQAKRAAGDFTLEQQTVFSDAYAPGFIVAQVPKAGTQVEIGSTIHVSVSKGSQFVTIPNLEGQPQAQALQTLEGLGFDVTTVEEGSSTIPQGAVIGTDPAQQAPNGGSVTLRVSVGDKVLVPDEYGKPLQTAVAELQQAGLVVGAQSPQSCSFIKKSDPSFDCSAFPNGGVVSATLQWKSWVPRDSPISIAYFDASLP